MPFEAAGFEAVRDSPSSELMLTPDLLRGCAKKVDLAERPLPWACSSLTLEAASEDVLAIIDTLGEELFRRVEAEAVCTTASPESASTLKSPAEAAEAKGRFVVWRSEDAARVTPTEGMTPRAVAGVGTAVAIMAMMPMPGLGLTAGFPRPPIPLGLRLMAMPMPTENGRGRERLLY